MRKALTAFEKLEKYAMPEPNSGCWLWTGTYVRSGYGKIYTGSGAAKTSKQHTAHRISYEMKFGKIPKNILVCHKCDTRACVNPDHLFLGSYTDNMTDCKNKGRTQRGSDRHNAILFSSDIPKIRAMFLEGKTHEKIAEIFKASRGTISQVLRGETWAWVK